MVNICPVCGYPLQWPAADFHICPSCGTEFGYDDAGRTHDDLRAAWIQAGSHWWSTATPAPLNWNPGIQLLNLQTATDPIIKAARITAANQTLYTQWVPNPLSELGKEPGQQKAFFIAGLSSDGRTEAQRAFAA